MFLKREKPRNRATSTRVVLLRIGRRDTVRVFFVSFRFLYVDGRTRKLIKTRGRRDVRVRAVVDGPQFITSDFGFGNVRASLLPRTPHVN